MRKNTHFLFFTLLILFSVLVFHSAKAERNQPDHSTSSHNKGTSSKVLSDVENIDLSVVLAEVYDISISKGDFKIVAETTLQWQEHEHIIDSDEPVIYTGSDVDKKLSQIWHPQFVIYNSETPRDTQNKSLSHFPDGHFELYEKFNATIAMNTDIKTYPFGTLDLYIELSAFAHPSDEMVLEPILFEIGHSGHEHEAIKGNWTIESHHTKTNSVSGLNFGGKPFSHNEFHFEIKHDFVDVLQKIFIPIFSIMLISIFINVFGPFGRDDQEEINEYADMRIGGQLTLLLTVFALKFSLGDDIPTTHYLNLIDLIFITSMLLITFNLLTSIIILYWFNINKYDQAKKWDNFLNFGSPAFLVLGLVLCIWITFS